MNDVSTTTVKFSSPVRYEGNLFFLIFFLIILLPLGVLMFIRRGYFVHGGSRFGFRYHGSWFWLYFWGIFLFPVAVLLLIFKGVDITQEAIRP